MTTREPLESVLKRRTRFRRLLHVDRTPLTESDVAATLMRVQSVRVAMAAV